MFRIFYTSLIAIFLFQMGSAWADRQSPALVMPLKELFGHKAHEKAFADLDITCIQCHKFSKKPVVPKDHPHDYSTLKSLNEVCHRCHRGKVSLPIQRQCLLCHQNTDNLRPKDHLSDWQKRHGRSASIDRDACAQCHTSQACSTCHLKIDTVKQKVHSANFRLSHSISARSDPRSCTICHRSASFCISCHTGGRR